MATRSGRLAKSRNTAMLQEGLAHNLESIVEELKHKRKYKNSAITVMPDDIFDAARVVNKKIIFEKIDSEKKMLQNGYQKEPFDKRKMQIYYQRLRRKHNNKLGKKCVTKMSLKTLISGTEV
ncbi:MAG: hypothetical protein E7302_13385 [Butyrivibrio sp.]|nr:hypothetical protein [Butyrivibrio sp.]